MDKFGQICHFISFASLPEHHNYLHYALYRSTLRVRYQAKNSVNHPIILPTILSLLALTFTVDILFLFRQLCLPFHALVALCQVRIFHCWILSTCVVVLVWLGVGDPLSHSCFFLLVLGSGFPPSPRGFHQAVTYFYYEVL